MWREAGVTCADFGVQDAFVKGHDLGKLFPSEEMDKLVAALIEEGASAYTSRQERASRF